MTASDPKLKVCAVSYLNTVPLVWGMLHGAQRGLFDLDFCLPAECADRLAARTADIGIVPSIELVRLGLEVIPGAGIASRGPVRSILLVSKCRPERIRTLAADSSSRTSTVLARVILARRYGAEPAVAARPPDLPAMLRVADAALIIGDPALRIEPSHLPLAVLDLGAEWEMLTGLPMVFAVWGCRKEVLSPPLAEAFAASCRFGMDNLEDIAHREAAARGVTEARAREYLTRNVVFELGDREYQGMRLFLRYASDFDKVAFGGAGV